MFLQKKNDLYICFSINWALKLGGQSGPVKSKSRWPGGQIKWPRANGPVLTTCLFIYVSMCVHVGVCMYVCACVCVSVKMHVSDV